MGRPTGQEAVQLYPEGGDRFFPKEVDIDIEFVADASGKVTAVVLHQGGREHRGEKTK